MLHTCCRKRCITRPQQGGLGWLGCRCVGAHGQVQLCEKVGRGGLVTCGCCTYPCSPRIHKYPLAQPDLQPLHTALTPPEYTNTPAHQPPLVLCRVPVHANIHAIATQNGGLADAAVQGSTAPTTACNATLLLTCQLLGQRLQKDARPLAPAQVGPPCMPTTPEIFTHLLPQLPATLHQPMPLQQGQAGAMWCGAGENPGATYRWANKCHA